MAGKPTYEELEKKIRALELEAEKRKLVEKTLHQQSQILSSIKDTIVIITPEMKTIYANQTAKTLFGGHPEMFTEPCYRFFKNRETVCENCPVLKTIRDEKPHKAIMKSYDKNGREMWRFNAAFPFYDHDGKLIAGIEIVTDYTPEKKAGEALKESQQRLSQIINFLPDATMVIDLEGKVIAWNHAIERMTGIKGREMLGKGNYEYAIPFYGERRPVLIDIVGKWDKEIQKKYRYIKEEGESLVSETYDPLVKPGGFLWNKASLLYDHNGKVIGAIETIRDITEKRVAEEALRESEARYRILFEQMTHGAFRQGMDGRIVDINQAALSMFGLTREEFSEIPAEVPGWDVIQEDGSPVLPHEHPSIMALRTGKPVSGVVAGVLNQKTQERFWLEINAIPEFRPGEMNPYQVMVTMHDLTAYKLSQAELQESEDKFRSFAEQSLVGIYLLSEGIFKYVNPRFAEIFGYSVEECLDDMHFRKLVHPEDLATVEKQVRRRLSGETKSVRYSYRCIRKNGDTIHVEIFGSSIFLKGKNVATGTMLDITDAKRSEALLQLEKENLSTTLENNPHGIVLIDNSGRWIYGNPMFTEITGYTLDEIQTGREWFQRAFPNTAYRKKVISVWKNSSRNAGKWKDFEFDVTCKDGQVKQIEFSTTQLTNRSISVLTDVTVRKKIEKSLHEYKLFLDNISDLAYMADRERNLIYANPAVEKITGLALSEIIDRPFVPLFVEKDHDSLTEVHNRTLAGESLENTLTFNSGTTCHFTSLPFKDNNGDIVGTFGIARDISDRLKAEKALKETEKRLKKAQSVAKLGNWEYSISTGEVWGSEEAFRIYGIERTSPYLPLDQVEASISGTERVNQALVDLIQENKRYDIEYEIREEATGQTKVIHSIAELVSENGIPVKVLGVIQDVTEQKAAEKKRKELEDQLQHAKKMEAIGMLAGGVAHDLNNILGGLVGYPQLLLLQLPEDSPLRKSILTIQKSGEKAAAVVQDLLTLARRGVVVSEAVNLNDVISEYLKSPEHEKLLFYHPGVHLKTHLEKNIHNILGSSTHLSKTVMNLISNAAEAMPDGGQIAISTENRHIDNPIKSGEDVKEGDYVAITISDTGTGIPPKDLKKIFEPFYTNKKMGRSGTGLGMAVTWGTVKDHKGYIDVKSAEGKGTTFTLYFPATREELPENESSLPIGAFSGNGESILIVDDVEEQRQIASAMLKELGYSVASVSGGEEAVEYLKTHEVDLLVLDMIMTPGMDGFDTYKKILEMHPGQKAIIASGFSETGRVKEVQVLGAGAYIKKPFLLEKIGPAVKEELDKR